MKKGDLVRVRTTNGGDVTATLLENYRPTYDALISVNGACVIITAWRLASIERA